MDKNTLDSVSARVAKAKAQRKSLPLTGNDVTLVAVTKNHSVDVFDDVVRLGLTDVAENRVQEAKIKQELLGQKRDEPSLAKLRWHLIGHLQTNKARLAVKLFQIIESVDSIRLMELLDSEAKRIGKVQEILLQINIAEEAQKTGFSIAEYREAVAKINDFPNLKVRGLMLIAPATEDTDRICSVFQKGYEEFVRLQKDYSVDILSMGMTDDFEIAVTEGSNEVRIGRAFFGDRDYSIKF